MKQPSTLRSFGFIALLGYWSIRVISPIPAASVLAFVTLLLGIIQIGPTILFIPIVVWSWLVMETGHALMFTAYMVKVGLIDNALRPLLMARGLTTAMPVILVGIIGGTIAYDGNRVPSARTVLTPCCIATS